jgi:NitT/TauT family transport system substrate-binding protein
MLRFLLLLGVIAVLSPASAADVLRIGVQKTGTFAWQMDVVRRHKLAEKADLTLEEIEFSSPNAGKLALNAGTVDIVVVDWLWVARERTLGRKLQFYPYSTAVGAIMTRHDAPIHKLSDLKDRTLSIAGGPLDKSWLIVQAAAMRRGFNIKDEATLQYGAPPLIFQKALQGEADASLNYWNFCARLQAHGFRPLYDIRAAQAELGLAQPVALLGYAFSEEFADAHTDAMNRFLSTMRAADDILLHSDAEWEALRPLMQVDDEATFLAYRDGTREGIPQRRIDDEEADARRLFQTRVETAGPTRGGSARTLAPGLYYRPSTDGG